MFQRQRQHDGKLQGAVEKTGWGKEKRETNGEEKGLGTIMGGQASIFHFGM